MLKQRIWTALCLIPLVLLVLFWGPSWLYLTVLSLVFLAAAHEWLVLMKLPQRRWQILWWLLLVLIGVAGVYLPLKPVLWVSLAGWLIAGILVLRFPKSGMWFQAYAWYRLLAGLWLFIPAWLALIWLRTLPQGAYWVLLVLLLVWGADIGGYFAGRFLGKHLLAKAVSPKKTVEGLLGGLVLALLAGGTLVFAIAPHWLSEPLLWLVLLATVLLSVLGDLTESLFKRIQGVKDSGTLLPGHGGLLDRMDSLFAAAPMFALGMALLTQI